MRRDEWDERDERSAGHSAGNYASHSARQRQDLTPSGFRALGGNTPLQPLTLRLTHRLVQFV